jgi:glycosyltransferase involved in cell wall biosynthesis
MHVVFISYYYPPSPEVGSVRPAKMVRALLAAGHHVTVVTARRPETPEQIATDSDRLTVKTVAVLPGPDRLYLWSKATARRLTHRASTDPSATGAAPVWVAPKSAPGWKRFLYALGALPDGQRGFILPAFRAAFGAVRGGADVIVTTAPPFSAHLAGLLLKRLTGRRWAADFRDPWTENLPQPGSMRTGVTDAANRWLERRCFAAADRILCTSQGIGDYAVARLSPGQRDRAQVVLNGIDTLAPAVPSGPNRPVRVVHAGTFYFTRDPRPFLEALAATCRDRGLGPADVHVDLLGDCRWFNGISVEQEAQRLGLQPIVHFHDWLPQAAARQLMERADVLLLLAQGQPNQVPNKLYDYLGTRHRILAFADAEGETARMLTRVGGHYLVTTTDPTQAARLTDAALFGRDSAGPGDDAVLREWTTDRQMARLVSLLEELSPTAASGAQR